MTRRPLASAPMPQPREEIGARVEQGAADRGPESPATATAGARGPSVPMPIALGLLLFGFGVGCAIGAQLARKAGATKIVEVPVAHDCAECEQRRQAAANASAEAAALRARGEGAAVPASASTPVVPPASPAPASAVPPSAGNGAGDAAGPVEATATFSPIAASVSEG
jgi:hypothetical protein